MSTFSGEDQLLKTLFPTKAEIFAVVEDYSIQRLFDTKGLFQDAGEHTEVAAPWNVPRKMTAHRLIRTISDGSCAEFELKK